MIFWILGHFWISLGGSFKEMKRRGETRGAKARRGKGKR